MPKIINIFENDIKKHSIKNGAEFNERISGCEAVGNRTNAGERSSNTFSDEDRNDKTFRKMTFIINAIENGWSVKKRDDSYIFTKRHEGKKEIFRENYLETFIQSNFR